MSRIAKLKAIAVSTAFLLVVSTPPLNAASQAKAPAAKFQRVLLVSIDGMHALDYLNCSQGVKGINGGQPYCTNLAKLGATAVNYLDTSTSRPSDSFPGLMAIVTGGTPRLMGVFYDVAYDRVLAPPLNTTGNGNLAGPCIPGVANGTTTEY